MKSLTFVPLSFTCDQLHLLFPARRYSFTKGEFQRHITTCRRNTDISLHLLVQCTAEVCAIKWRNAHFVRYPFQGLSFTRHDQQLSIGCTFHSKSMRHIPILLQVSDMEVHFITHPDPFDVVRGKVRADGRDINMHLISFPYDLSFFLSFSSIWMVVVLDLENLH